MKKQGKTIEGLERDLQNYKTLYELQKELSNTYWDSCQKTLNRLLELSNLLRGSFNLIAETPGLDKLNSMTEREIIARGVNYRENLYGYIMSRGLIADFLKYHETINMLEAGGHELCIDYLVNNTPPDTEAEDYIDPKLN